MYTELLQQLNLNSSEIEIYSSLLQKGTKTVQELTALSKLSRTNIYNVLNSLEDQGLIEQKKQGNKALFIPLHPNKLAELLENQEKSLKLAKANLQADLPALISDYNMAVGKPGVQFFEGMDGMRRVLADTLTSKEDILTYVDNDAFLQNKELLDEDFKYLAKRKKIGLQQKILVKEGQEERKSLQAYYTQGTQVKYIAFNLSAFKTLMYIYNNKIAYVTLKPDSMIAVIIEDEFIHQMHKDLYKAMWNQAND